MSVMETKVLVLFAIRERSPFGYEVTRLVRKSEGLEARDYVHFIPSMILH